MDGCGPPGIAVHEPFGLTRCCDDHDRCYSTCGRSFQDCEKSFSSCLVDRCTNTNITEHAANLTPELCIELATNLTAVSGALGAPFWEKTQQTDCDCPVTDVKSLYIQ